MAVAEEIPESPLPSPLESSGAAAPPHPPSASTPTHTCRRSTNPIRMFPPYPIPRETRKPMLNPKRSWHPVDAERLWWMLFASVLTCARSQRSFGAWMTAHAPTGPMEAHAKPPDTAASPMPSAPRVAATVSSRPAAWPTCACLPGTRAGALVSGSGWADTTPMSQAPRIPDRGTSATDRGPSHKQQSPILHVFLLLPTSAS